MVLLIDVGNTVLKCAIFNGDRLIDHAVIPYHSVEKFTLFISNYKIDSVAISKVKMLPEEIKTALKQMNVKEVNWDKSLKLPILISYKTPQTLGHDRICNAVAAHAAFPNKDCLVIDLGTCNKYDFINRKGEYLGGSISPGFEMRFLSMNTFTDQLPLIPVSETHDFIGDSTENSMKSGVFYGIIGEINYYIEQYKSQFNDIEIILTGGFLTYFDKALKNHIFADPYLTLKGLNIILNFQEE
jgi:type III pantothenate kinase